MAYSPCIPCLFRFGIIAFLFLPLSSHASTAGETTSSKELNPINLLITLAEKPSQDEQDEDAPDVSNVRTPPARPKPTRRQRQNIAVPVPATPVNFAAQIDKELPQSSFADKPAPASNQDENLTRRLWLSRITFPRVEEDEKNKKELQQIIDRIRSVKFEPQETTPQPFIVVEPPPPLEPQKLPNAKLPQETREKEIKPKLPYEQVTNQTLKLLTDLSKHPDQLDNPFELAEVLFLSGHLKEAVPLYHEALNRKDPNQIALANDRAWIMFQTANCLRDDDPPAAAKMYKQLIADYPESPWTDLARAREQLIEWYLKDNPKTLTKEYRP